MLVLRTRTVVRPHPYQRHPHDGGALSAFSASDAADTRRSIALSRAEEDKKFDRIFVLRTNTSLNPLQAMLCYKQLLLAVHIAGLFDRGVVSFDDDGRILLSCRLGIWEVDLVHGSDTVSAHLHPNQANLAERSSSELTWPVSRTHAPAHIGFNSRELALL
jgi:hypothetical protein